MTIPIAPRSLEREPAGPADAMRRAAAACCLAVLLLLGSACSLGTGTGNGGNTALIQTVAQTRATYQILNLATGTITPSGSIPDLQTNPLYRTTDLVFRLLPGGATMEGTPSTSLGGILDPPSSMVEVPSTYLSVFETSQQQWQLIAGTSPWTTLVSATSSDDIRVGSTYPAIGISLDAAQAACSAYASAHAITLGLPSDSVWEAACRAGSSATYAWGESTDPSVVAPLAVVFETSSGRRGALTIGDRPFNAFGYADMEGNVWELTQDGHVRGGSWNDPLTLARCANLASEAHDTAHLLVGVRFTYQP
jgi:formylglycine-generating enzyme required for sulfatase activity